MRNDKYYPWFVGAVLCIVGILNYFDRKKDYVVSSNVVETIPIKGHYLLNNIMEESWKEDSFTGKNIWIAKDEKK